MAKDAAETSTRISPVAIAAPSGRMMISAPAKPTSTAAQRRGPTRSPSRGTDRAVTISGAVKLIDDAVASATVDRATR